MPDLPRIYKGAYPFTLACPSFVFPAGYAENVRRLGPVVDEVELLFFESTPGALPEISEIEELAALARAHDITYNVHLPTDVALSHPDHTQQDHAIDALKTTITLSLPLAPSSFTLHVPYTEPDAHPERVRQWQQRVKDAAARFLSTIPVPSRSIAVETLHYPFDYLHDIIMEFDFSVCLDTGHVMACGNACAPVFDRYCDRIPILHVHGLRQDRDHIALTNLSHAQAEDLGHILSSMRATVSLEVFSVDQLAASLDYLRHLWHNINI